ncbi:DUF3560 domain-containing protein [Streptomyces sp. NPDC051561]|uniref:DUF3560 domain-containing protein n=1 Tax=Streptomyces sp. NPDC051561 TaxID=3365658 RepID=UPI0037B06021
MTIEITHTRREGTLVEGTSRGDGSAEVLKLRDYGRNGLLPFKWSRHLGSWYLPHSRDKQAEQRTINLAADRLRTEGFEVTVSIDNADRRTFEEAEEDRTERAEFRAERYAGYADNAASRSDAAWKAARQIADGIPFGQPILVGHHSEARARRDHERIDRGYRKSFTENDKAKHWASREQAAANYEAFRKAPGRTLRRIAKLDAEIRRYDKWLKGESAGGFTRNISDPEQVEELTLQRDELMEERAYWQGIVKQAEEAGYKVWSRADFQRGDFVRARGHWYEVLRVNPKSVTVPSILNVHQPVVTKANSTFGDMTHTIPYDDVHGRLSADEMRERLEPAAE